ncbi:MAG TPA: hypothetical protein VMC05_11745 [Xanthobacteraceae bacterium]|nr:hypothetical protein [Xanthobacteraceae bacterium]
MRKIVIGLAAAASLGLASVAAPAPANAYCTGCAVGAGILGGIAAGAIVGSAIANSPPPPPAYYGPPPPPPPAAYYPPPPGPGYAELAPGCYWGKRKVWIEGYGYRWRTVQICR